MKKEVLHTYVVISILHLKVLFLRCMNNPSIVAKKIVVSLAQSTQLKPHLTQKENMPKPFMKKNKSIMQNMKSQKGSMTIVQTTMDI